MSRTRLPEYVIVYGKEIPVVLKDGVFDSKGEEMAGNTDGNTIWINSKEPKKEHLGILLHEIYHCLVRRTGVYYREDHCEHLEEQMAEYFQTVVQENFILRSKH